MNNYKLIKYENKEIALDVRFDEDNNTIWLSQSEIASIFGIKPNSVLFHIKNVIRDENIVPTYEWDSQVQTEGNRKINRKVKLYNLDMIEAISKRSKSNSGYDFIKWANDILKSNNNLSIAEFSPNEDIKSKIYQIRGVQVMLDFELAELYGYETFRFNEQVKNNIEKFPSDFMFRLSEDEVNKNLISKKSMSSWGGRRTLPYAFTEQGIYMLMTVLKGELATRQSIIIIRTFKAMKDYIVENGSLLLNTNPYIEAKFSSYDKRFENIEDKLEEVMDNFIDPSTHKHFVFFKGERIESDIAYQDIYSKAKHNIYIIDDYISLKTLQLLKGIDKKIKVIIFSDNKDKMGLSSFLFNDFIKDTNLNITLLHNNTYHDRYIILDYGYKDMKVFHSGASSKDGGNSGYEIDEREYPHDYDLRIKEMLKNNELMLK